MVIYNIDLQQNQRYKMEIVSAQYVIDIFGNQDTIKATINGVECYVPINAGNEHYAEIMRQVEAGELTIQEAE